jgi:hypothetical protein
MYGKFKGKAILQLTMEALRIARRSGSHSPYKNASQVALNLTAFRAGSSLAVRKFMVIIFRGRIDTRAILRLVGLGNLENQETSGSKSDYKRIRKQLTQKAGSAGLKFSLPLASADCYFHSNTGLKGYGICSSEMQH